MNMLSSSTQYRNLSRNERKIAIYSDELEAVRSLDIFTDFAGTTLAQQLGRTAIVVLKPEALKSGLSTRIVNWLTVNGFIPIHGQRVSINQAKAQAIWRYQWNAATADRVQLHLLIAEDTDWYAIFLRDRFQPDPVPASVRLWGLKGSSKNGEREPYQLRAQIGMKNRMLGFVHTPDEPADMVRELGILFTRAECKHIFESIVSRQDMDFTSEILEDILSYEKAIGRHSADYDEVASRLSLDVDLHQKLMLASGHKSGKPDLKTIIQYLEENKVADGLWDKFVIAAEHIAHDQVGVKPILDAGAFKQIHDKWLMT